MTIKSKKDSTLYTHKTDLVFECSMELGHSSGFNSQQQSNEHAQYAGLGNWFRMTHESSVRLVRGVERERERKLV